MNATELQSPSTRANASAWRVLRAVVGISWEADRARTATMFAFKVAEGLTGVVTAYGFKLLLDAVVAHHPSGAYQAAAVVLGAQLAGLAANWAGFMLRMRVREHTNLLVDLRLIDLITSVPGIEHLERADYADELLLLRDERERLSSITDAAAFNVQILTMSVTTLALLAKVHPLLLLLPLFGIPSIYFTAKWQRLDQAARDSAAEPLRARDAMFTLATKAPPAKEVRLFGMAPEIRRRYTHHHQLVLSTYRRADIAGVLLTTAGWLIFALGFAGAMAFVVIRAAHRQATIGDVVLALSLAAQLNAQLAGAVNIVAWLLNTLKTGRRYVWLRDYATAAHADLTTPDPAPAPDRLRHGITLEGVRFAYPGTDIDVLRDVDIHLPAGSTIAIVGENGAGKTTLVKLLCRFYEPTEGRLLVDDVDLRRLDINQWRARTSAAFQDYASYELVARQAVGVGHLPAIDNANHVLGALADASASDVLDDLADGLDSLLGRSFDNGVELSGGQWQKLALGRAMMRHAPLLLVLDEPTAALDARTEHALFTRFTHAARRAEQDAGAITVIVSHRFSTVRMADLILVVNRNEIAEAGTHEQLIAAGGLYAELYELQAASYR